jgi:hypothetical protein
MSGRRRIDVTATQAVASMLAALTGAVAASRLGIAGTIIGTAFMSLASTVGAATYKFYLARSNERLRKAAENFGTRTGHRTADEAAGRAVDTAVDSAVTREQTARVSQTASGATWTVDATKTEVLPVVRMTPGGVTGRTDGAPTAAEPANQPARWTRRKWIMVAATALGVFVVVMGGVTVFEAIAGRPLDAVVWHQKGSGTTIGSLVSGGSGGHHGGGGAPGRSSSPSTSPSSSTSARPSTSPSSSPSSTATSPTATPTPTPSSATPAPSASPDPAASSGSARTAS